MVNFVFDERPPESSFVDVIWRTQHAGGGTSFTSLAESRWGMVITRQKGRTTVTVRGPETKAMPAPVPEEAEFFGINFKLGTFMPQLPASDLVDGEINLPDASSKSFWLHGSAWEMPTFENADTFIQRLIHDGLLMRDPVVDAVLQGESPALTVRSIRRRFLQATGLPYKVIQQIERAKQASALLQQGVPILDTVFELGYFDQPHLTKSLKYFIGQTPAQILRSNAPE